MTPLGTKFKCHTYGEHFSLKAPHFFSVPPLANYFYFLYLITPFPSSPSFPLVGHRHFSMVQACLELSLTASNSQLLWLQARATMPCSLPFSCCCQPLLTSVFHWLWLCLIHWDTSSFGLEDYTHAQFFSYDTGLISVRFAVFPSQMLVCLDVCADDSEMSSAENCRAPNLDTSCLCCPRVLSRVSKHAPA